MTVLNKAVKQEAPRLSRPEAAPALFRLLSDSALSRAALGACGFPLLLLDANAPGRTVTYVNAAFEQFFGLTASEALGRPLAKLLFRGDEAMMQKLFVEPGSRCELKAWDKKGEAKNVELALGAIRSADGKLSHWVAAFSDRTDVERLRAELEAAKAA
jgi:PAS domain S-box-containing protein